MGITIAAPEYTVTIALKDYVKAEQLVREPRRLYVINDSNTLHQHGRNVCLYSTISGEGLIAIKVERR
jgi:ribosomal protein L36